VFDQYLRTTQIPVLKYYYSKDNKYLFYKWDNCVTGFNLQLQLSHEQQKLRLYPTTEWKKIELTNNNKTLFDTAFIQKNYYVSVEETKEK
jgi:hypothetical protein